MMMLSTTLTRSQASDVLKRAAELEIDLDVNEKELTVRELLSIANEVDIDAEATRIAIREVLTESASSPMERSPELSLNGGNVRHRSLKSNVLRGAAVGVICGVIAALIVLMVIALTS